MIDVLTRTRQLYSAAGPSETLSVGPRRLSGHPVVIGVGANPEPEDAALNVNSQGPVVKADPHGPDGIDLLEVQ